MNDKKEIEIYVATDEQGVIVDFSLLELKAARRNNIIVFLQYSNVSHKIVDCRPITCYSTDNIIGKHWTDVGLRERRLKKCLISPNWVILDDEFIEYKNGMWTQNFSSEKFPDLYSALSQLIPLTSE